jgi:integrase
MTTDEREALVAHWLEAKLDAAEDFRALGGPFSDTDRETKTEILHDQMEDASEQLLAGNYARIEHEAVELLRVAGVNNVDPDSAEFGRLCRRLLQAKLDYLQIEQQRWDGRYETREQRRRVSVAAAAPSATPPATQRVTPPAAPVATSPKFSEIVDRYFRENPRAARSADQAKIEFGKFMAVIGDGSAAMDRPVNTITKEHGRAYKTDLMDVRKLHLLTVGKHIATLSGLFRWAEGQGYIGENPMKGLAPNKKAARKAMTKRRPFTDAELVQLFGSKDFTTQRDKNPTRYWLFLLLLFTMARREEIGQLTVADVQEEDGIAFLRITDEVSLQQNLKNEGSRRRVPIAHDLIRLGFMDYVERIRKAGHVRLFPDLKKGKNGFSDAPGKWLARIIGKTVSNDPALVVHSLRGGGITKLHGVGVSDNVIKYLVGHQDGGVHDSHYVKRDLIPLRLLKEGIDRLDYAAVVKVLMAGTLIAAR